MAGTAQYTREEILWILTQVTKFKVKDTKIMNKGFKAQFGRPLAANQFRYVKNKYGRDPLFNCGMVTQNAKLRVDERAKRPVSPILPITNDVLMGEASSDAQNVKMSSSDKMDTDDAKTMTNGGNSPVADTMNYTTTRAAPLDQSYHHHHHHQHGAVQAPPAQPHPTIGVISAQKRAKILRRLQLESSVGWQVFHGPEFQRRYRMGQLQQLEMRHLQQMQQRPLEQCFVSPQQIPRGWPNAANVGMAQQAQGGSFVDPEQDQIRAPVYATESSPASYTTFSEQQMLFSEFAKRAQGTSSHGQDFPPQTWLDPQSWQGMGFPEYRVPETAVAAPQAWMVLEGGASDPATAKAEANEVETTLEQVHGQVEEDSSSEVRFTPCSSDYESAQECFSDDAFAELLMPLRDDVYYGEASFDVGVSNGTETATVVGSFQVTEGQDSAAADMNLEDYIFIDGS
ncbi:hypothetical protein PWT90_05511 [Aphanocladium album]|nr:hypothetical protein PWT90_05511 [Aphanocladium album]